MPACEAMTLAHRIDGTKFALDHDEGRKHEHESKDDPRHDEQDESDGDGERKQNRRSEIFPKRPRMPKQGEIGGGGIVVRCEVKCRRTHAEERAEREIDYSADDRRLLGGAGERGIDAALT